MTAAAPVTPASGPADPAAGRHAGFAGLLRAEWTKIRSVRSTVWTLVIFVVVCIGFTALIAWLTESNWFARGPRNGTSGSWPTRSASSWAPGSAWGSWPSPS